MTPGQEDPLEKEMATHSSILAWKIPWTEEAGGLQSMGSQSQTRLSNFTSLHSTPCKEVTYEGESATPVPFLVTGFSDSLGRSWIYEV